MFPSFGPFIFLLYHSVADFGSLVIRPSDPTPKVGMHV